MQRILPFPLIGVLFAVLLSSSLHAQQTPINTYPNSAQPGCGTEMSAEDRERLDSKRREMRLLEQQYLEEYAYKDLIPMDYMAVKVHVLCDNAGSNCAMSVADVNAALDTMNSIYEGANIQFYQCGPINFINNTTFLDMEANTDEGPMTATHNVANTCNIYFCRRVTSNGTSLCGYAYYPGGPDVIMMDAGGGGFNCSTNGSTLSHEVGHFLALPHTHDAGNELVNGTNCTTAGDEMCDTPADPTLGTGNVNTSCVYTGSSTDANGDPYAPNPRNLMSYSRKNCRDFFSPQQYARIRAAFHTFRPYRDCPTLDADFTVDNTRTCGTSLSVNFTDNSTGATSWEWDVDGDGGVDYTSQNPSHTYNTSGVYDVQLTVSNGSESVTRRKQSLVVVGASENIPYFQNFDNFELCYDGSSIDEGWQSSSRDNLTTYRWNVYNAFGTPLIATYNQGTPSSNTGPLADNTTGAILDKFLYTEASEGSTGDVVELYSPCIDLNVVGPELQFSYHMFGANMGELHVDINNGGGWTNDITTALVGQQQAAQADAFSTRNVSLLPYAGQTVMLRFRAVRGAGFASDIAIDDVSIRNNPLLDVSLASFVGDKVANQENQLFWQTAQEDQSAYFELQRSANAVDFEPIAEIQAAGDSESSLNYTYTDTDPETRNQSYYRLKMVDQNGAEEFSQIISLAAAPKAISKFMTYPNPISDEVNVYIVAEEESSETPVIMYNTLGQEVFNAKINLQKGQNNFKINMESQPDNVYLLIIKHSGKSYSKRLVKN